MKAKRLGLDKQKKRCDRCQQDSPPIHECRFSFPYGYAHWKALWQARTGKRLTNRRKQNLLDREDVLDLRHLSKVVYWMDLCPACWEVCSTAACDGWPGEFYQRVLAPEFVPTK